MRDLDKVDCLLDPAMFHPGQYLTFRLAGTDLAIPAEPVRGILPLHEMHVGDEDASALGWLKGREFPIIDLRKRLGLPAPAAGREPMIVVVETVAGRIFGFVVDRISGLVEARRHDYRRGKLRMGGRPRRVLDVDLI